MCLIPVPLWITLNPYQGLKLPLYRGRLRLPFSSLNYLESLSGIEAASHLSQGWLRKAWALWITLNPYQGLKGLSSKTRLRQSSPLWITLNPYQGLKHRHSQTLVCQRLFELPWIPIRDWNIYSKHSKRVKGTFELPWIPIRDWNIYAIKFESFTSLFELPWIPIRDWNMATSPRKKSSSTLWITLNPYQGLKLCGIDWCGYL